MQEAHEALYEVEQDQQQAHTHLAAELAHQEQVVFLTSQSPYAYISVPLAKDSLHIVTPSHAALRSTILHGIANAHHILHRSALAWMMSHASDDAQAVCARDASRQRSTTDCHFQATWVLPSLQENAELREAIAVAQQQLHGAAAAAASRVLSQQALEGQQQAAHQAHLLVHYPSACCMLRAFCGRNPCCHRPSSRLSMSFCSWTHKECSPHTPARCSWA